MDKLNFLTAGVPISAKNYLNTPSTLRALNLDGIEFEFVHGVSMASENIKFMKENKGDLIYTAHSPYYINLNAQESEKVESSIERILQTARMANELGCYSIVYHAGFYMGNDKKEVQKKILACHKRLSKALKDENLNVWIRPETTGKPTQWGDLYEIVDISSYFDNILPCVDFSHLHARSNGKFNTYEEFCKVFEYIGEKLGQVALDNFHAHIAGIEYSIKGERHHLNLEDSDMNYKDLLRAFKKYDIKGAITCESPNIEEDCKLLKDYFLTL